MLCVSFIIYIIFVGGRLQRYYNNNPVQLQVSLAKFDLFYSRGNCKARIWDTKSLLLIFPACSFGYTTKQSTHNSFFVLCSRYEEKKKRNKLLLSLHKQKNAFLMDNNYSLNYYEHKVWYLLLHFSTRAICFIIIYMYVHLHPSLAS